MKRNIKKIIKDMTLEEKAGMCSGKDFWHLKGVERLGIPSVMVSDGPHGLRKQDNQADHLGIYDSIKAVCFPAACATAASFDRKLLEDMGTALGKECQAEDISILLGPGVNIKRSPICGRNFEYFSEDPYLAGELGASFVNGVQSQNVGTSVKHFAANNQEYRRGTISSEADERTLREIYLAAFETIVKKAKPWTLMCSYNKVNGVFASENKKLLTDILRDEWGYEGFVMSDWGAVNKRVLGLEAGLDLEMPSSNGITDGQIIEAVKEGNLSEKILDRTVERILETVFRYTDYRTQIEFDREKDHDLAVKIEEESAVLLKNEKQILPLNPKSKIAFLGEYAKSPRYQGGGSSHINAGKISNAHDFAGKIADIIYEPAFAADRDEINEQWFADAISAAKTADAAVIFAGLPESFESEGYDRKHMLLPDCQNKLIHEVSQVQPNTIVVLHNGSPIEMPWINQVAGILELYLGGQGVGEAAVRLLFGIANPSGKLPESFPICLANNPSYLNFPGDGHTVEYREGIYVGYRYYDKKELPVLFPFGHGLSYTTFSYTNLQLEKDNITDQDTVKVSVDITNTGKTAGKETVQLYISDLTGATNRPVRELKGFEKVFLYPGDTETVEFILDKRSFAWYHTGISDWYCATGQYAVEIGKSSRDIELTKKIQIKSTKLLPININENTTFGELLMDQRTHDAIMEILNKRKSEKQEDTKDEKISEMMRNMIENAPIRALRSWRGMDDTSIEEMIAYLQGFVE
ncbi:MAG: glycosyl hydrolase [Anaerocolumna sp.]|jgi:beta-glucosidase|nr:glycosyl hydrolase [Anaerocolumna sp.]